MTRPRETIVSLETTPYYHVVTRCVRRAFLCGKDPYSEMDYNHRRKWFMERLRLLRSVFSINIAAYAVMSNHYHLVVFIEQDQASKWTDDEVIERWRKIFYGPQVVQKYVAGQNLTPEETEAVKACASKWRERLTSLSWFIRCLNEHIARLANVEDNCTGRFWESRFKSQALLDEKAILSCMAYVDLNPIRATMANTPEESEFTSVQERIQHLKNNDEETPTQPKTLLPFAQQKQLQPRSIACTLSEYLELVDWTGRQIRKDKRGAIDANMPRILRRLDIAPSKWMELSLSFESKFSAFAGCVGVLEKVKTALQALRMPGMGFAKSVFGFA